ncbi:heat-inducible transcriptional repressor HrcA [Brevibacterium sp. UCMA 11754]|uniref:heat-inducible transcriptional repressor HrcA n=1 Tax=Brevibacterium sp. UCMA 11754 TaxID=2749198 RepID=UPI001F0165D3|nr:heat-inducible transcriptional repressor HrcA [Brevibacterium sp. UCMA 11754]MCF2571547.1 heat-inducible transcriptional repressor HrcA [Brevibacterium sp. UCMA 11754]MCF2571551.1 heat-inducible transcriptional repressor HrcA [Brevibacterium sp. UCMA 11754]
MNDSRRAQVLRAIVEDFVATNEPVGSKAIVQRHTLGVSPATIRNDMAHLEQEGYIAQPHTSAGRIPTDLGYRMFVDRIDDFKPLTHAERRAIFQLIDGNGDLDDMLDRTVRVLSGLTHQVALIQYPTVSRATIKHIEVVGLGPNRILVVLITDAGQVEQKIVITPGVVDDESLRGIRDEVNAEFSGQKLSRVVSTATPRASAQNDDGTQAESVVGAGAVGTDVAAALVQVRSAVTDLVIATREERIIMAGTANLARSGREFGEKMAPILEAFEEQVVLLKLLTSMAEDQEEISVRIGRENTHESFSSTSLVAAEYGHDAGSTARLAVLGPTRMDYPTTITAVRAVAKYVSSVLDQG